MSKQPSRVVQENVDALIERERAGRIEHGDDMDRTDFPVEAWLAELISESLDSANYGRKLQHMLPKLVAAAKRLEGMGFAWADGSWQAPKHCLSADEVNALPERVRKYIMWLETNADPGHTMQDNFRLIEENAGLRDLIAERAAAVTAVPAGPCGYCCPNCGRDYQSGQKATDALATLINAKSDGVADTLRLLLDERNHRMDGDLKTLAERCLHLSREDRDLIAMRGLLIEKLQQRRAADSADLASVVDLAASQAMVIAHTEGYRWNGKHYDLPKDRVSQSGEPTWSRADADAAEAEGWCVSTTGSGYDEIQRLDEMERFPSDVDAISHVYWMAGTGGSDLHRRAILYTLRDGNRWPYDQNRRYPQRTKA